MSESDVRVLVRKGWNDQWQEDSGLIVSKFSRCVYHDRYPDDGATLIATGEQMADERWFIQIQMRVDDGWQSRWVGLVTDRKEGEFQCKGLIAVARRLEGEGCMFAHAVVEAISGVINGTPNQNGHPRYGAMLKYHEQSNTIGVGFCSLRSEILNGVSA